MIEDKIFFLKKKDADASKMSFHETYFPPKFERGKNILKMYSLFQEFLLVEVGGDDGGVDAAAVAAAAAIVAAVGGHLGGWLKCSRDIFKF